MLPTYSIIIPTFNESEPVARLLEQLRGFQRQDVEAVVADGGSTDATVAGARKAGARVTVCRRGRGTQLNHGANLAQGGILAFVHADSVLPRDFMAILDRRLLGQGLQAGAFPIRFDPPHPLLRLSAWWSRYDTVWTRYGDQGLVATRTAFERAGGYPDWPLMEDVEICRRLRRFTRVACLGSPITTSSRRFVERGVLRQRWANARAMLRFLVGGTSPQRLAAEYEARRPKPARDGLILFTRLPVPGKVKTRLAATVGAEEASRLYRRMAEGAVAQALAAQDAVSTYVFVADPAETEAVRDWLGDQVMVLGQNGADLGARMADAFETVFSFGHAKVLVAGTDVPGLTQGHLRQALAALDRSDLALGPARDGGYYLLGQKKHHPELFSGLPWSHPSLLARTLDRAAQLGLAAALLESLEDVDDAPSLARSGLARGTD